MIKFRDLKFKNKIYFSILGNLVLLSFVIALFTRWVLISSLTTELKNQGIGIARNIADRGRSFVLSGNSSDLTSLVFETRLGERRDLIVYVFVLDKDRNIISHTFINYFPENIEYLNRISENQESSIRQHKINERTIYDIAVPIKEGIYQIGAVHVGLNKKHIDLLLVKLRTTFLLFLSASTIIFFGISHILSKNITKPVTELKKMSDEIGRGNLDIMHGIGGEIECWKKKNCGMKHCPAYQNRERPCWYVDGTISPICPSSKFPEKLEECRKCEVYQKYTGDEIVQLAHSFDNMTVRLQLSEKELRESELKYRSLFNSGPNPIFVLDMETLEVLDANPSAEETYGFNKEDLLGKPMNYLGYFELENGTKVDFQKDGWPREEDVSRNIRYYIKGKKPFIIKVKTSPAFYKDKKALIVAATDITEMIEKDAQLTQASKMTTLGEMSAGMAHELNQPLNTIKIGNEYLKMMIEDGKEIPGEDLFQVASQVSGQVDRASEIINRLREFSRKSEFKKETVDINDPINGVLMIIGRQLMIEDIEVRKNLGSGLPIICAHKNRLEQVLFNLISNARDAINERTEKEGKEAPRIITFSTYTEGVKVVLCVSDTGIGIKDSALDKLFQPFYTTKEVGKGMGLGLSIIYGIVQEYEGDISVESDSEGVGTTFKIHFPVA